MKVKPLLLFFLIMATAISQHRDSLPNKNNKVATIKLSTLPVSTN
ncbi:hypothetical protein HMPREF0080_00644 [Anaeroglobus geminatus F0357]|uniref:Uncharacterized protein n=1 Tax=Anaeroglobus geminatus F0357 TaxID=861450 RepID=G9YG80_9FIRM|nr:hypothetical protein HMPREF0080_00644 [Anaeroglobus geminatus F0357]